MFIRHRQAVQEPLYGFNAFHFDNYGVLDHKVDPITIHPVHQAQLRSYMRLSGKHVGLLINFYVAHLRDGIKRMVLGDDWDQ